VPSHVVIWNESDCKSKFITIPGMGLRTRGVIRFNIVTNNQLKAIKSFINKDMSVNNCKVYVTDAPLNLAGYNILLFDLKPLSRGKKYNEPEMYSSGYARTSSKEIDVFARLPSYEFAQEYIKKIESKQKVEYKQYTNITNLNEVKPKNYKGKLVKPETYLADHKKVLIANGIPVRNLIFVKKQTDNSIHVAALTEYGVKQKVYAMYGQWEDQSSAAKLGYNKGDRVFFSEREKLAEDGSTHEFINSSVIHPAMRFGKEIFTYDQIESNKSFYYPKLAWRKNPYWSGMKRYYNSNKDLMKSGEEYPPSPLELTETTNPLPFIDCPDMEYYWDIFKRCVDQKTKVDEISSSPKQFQEYADYLKVKEMAGKGRYDGTDYNIESGEMTGKIITTENQPEKPLIFNSDAVLLNQGERSVYDPWATTTTFNLIGRTSYREWGITRHRHKAYDITDRVKPAINTCLSIYPNPFKLNEKGLSVQWTDEKYKDSNVYIGDPLNNWNKYESAKDFCTYDEYYVALGGNPFRTNDERVSNSNSFVDVFNQEDTKRWYLDWKWKIVYKDRNDNKRQVGTVLLSKFIYQETDKFMAEGQEEGGKKHNRWLTLSGVAKSTSDADKYDKNSKEYTTDQSDVSERNPKIDKGNATTEIIRKIIVAETFNLVVRAVYNQEGTIAKALYETNKRIENSLSVSQSYKIAKKAYHAYILWQQTMDALAEVRDTYQSIGPAWDGLLSSIHNVIDYYKELDYSKIRLTNITSILPAHKIMGIDMALWSLQSSLVNYSNAIDGLAFLSDKITKGNYGPFNPVINVTYSELSKSVGNSGYISSSIINGATDVVNQAKLKSTRSSGNAAYLSNITRAVSNVIVNQELSIYNDQVRSLSVALYVTERESRDWVTFKNHLSNVYNKTPEDVNSAKRNSNLLPLMHTYESPDIFRGNMDNYKMGHENE